MKNDLKSKKKKKDNKRIATMQKKNGELSNKKKISVLSVEILRGIQK